MNLAQRQKPSVPAESGHKPNVFSASCKFLCCAIFIIGVLLNLLLTTILLFGVENYHKADPVKIYEVFESPKYANTNQLLKATQYVVLYGEPQSGIINFIQHEANLRAIEGKPVVMREIQENIVHKHMKESKHFVEMYLGQVARGQHSWFILLENGDVPVHEIEALQKKYPKDSIVLVAHQELDIQSFTNHEFPALKTKELKQFMEKDLGISSKEVKQILELAASKDAPAIFQAYKSFEETKARAIEEAERLKKQQEEEQKLRLQEQARLAAEKSASEKQEGKKSKKDKKAAKGKKGKNTPQVEEEQVKQQTSVDQQEAPKKKKSNKKSKTVEPEPEQVKEEVQDQKPAKQSKKKSKKSNKKAVEQKTEEKLEEILEELPVEPEVEEQAVKVEEEQKYEGKKGKNKKNKKDKKSKIEEKQQENPKEEEEVTQTEQPAQVQESKEVETPVVEEVVETVEEVQQVKEEHEVKETKKAKGKGKKGDEKKQGKKGKKANKKSKQAEKAEPIDEELPIVEQAQQVLEVPSSEQPVVIENEQASKQETQ